MESPSEPRAQDPRFEGNDTMIKLCIEDDEGHQTLVPIIRDEITIGRQEGNTIRLTERNVSRRHARLVRQDDRLYVEEIEARYGTRKNGEKLSEREEFREGDVVVIGDYRLTLKAEAGASPAPEEAEAAPAGAVGGFSSQPTQITRRPEDRPRAGTEGTEILPALPAKIVIVSSNFAGQEFPLGRKEMVIGRGEECDIIIDHRSVSNKHSKITREGMSTYQIVDLNSKNGVRINGEKYSHVALKRGDIIELGHVKFRFVEPGENYVFSPLVEDDEDFGVSGSGPGGIPKVAIIAGVVLVAILLSAFAISSLMGPGDDPPKKDPTPIVDKGKTTPPKSDDGFDPKTAKGTEKIDQGIARAQTSFEEGDVKKAIGLLESLNEFSDPNPEQRDKIQGLLAKAKPERPLEDSFVAGKNNLQEKEYASAIVNFMRIPNHSIFNTLIQDRKMLSQAEAGLTQQAKDAYAEDKVDLAQSLARSWVEAAPNSEPAKTLLAEVSRRKQTPVANNTPRPPRVKKDPPKKKDPPRIVEMSSEEASTKSNEAMVAMANSQYGTALKLCRSVLKAKKELGKCNRIIGMSYKQQSDIPKACKYFRRAYKYEKKPGTLRQIEKLQCP